MAEFPGCVRYSYNEQQTLLPNTLTLVAVRVALLAQYVGVQGQPMRFLLTSDTHGNLEIINELAVHTKSDAVIHAGDFGFYHNDSYERLSRRRWV